MWLPSLKAFVGMWRSEAAHVAVLCVAFGLALLYGRDHWIEEGRALAPVKIVTQTVQAQPKIVRKYVQAKCPKSAGLF
jgi:hypothetical protein